MKIPRKKKSSEIVVPCADQSLVKNPFAVRSKELAPRKRGAEPTGNSAEKSFTQNVER